jgi:signal transduction histidine kinase
VFPQAHAGLLAGACAAVLVLLGAFAYLLVDSQSRLRNESEKRFQSRATVSAALTESLFASAAAQGQQEAAKRFGGPTIDKAALARRAKQSQLAYLRVIGGKGQQLAASPRAPAYARGDGERLPTYVIEALKGRPYLSNISPAGPGGRPTIEWALPFKTAFGPRILVNGMYAVQLTQFLATYLAKARESEDMEAHVIDDRGRIIANAAGAGARATRLDGNLTAALSTHQSGSYRKAGSEQFFASAPVTGSSWRVVVSEPKTELYPSIATARKWVLWGIFVGFAIAAFLSVLLLRRLLMKAAELSGANKELEKQKQAAQAASRAKGDFLANMSHELRTPLTSIIGYSELLMSDSAEKPDTERKFLGSVASNARHLEQLVNDILDLSKLEAGKMEFKEQQVDLTTLTGDLKSAMGVLAEQKQIQVVTEISPEVRWVTSDPPRLRQVLYNYLSNALKFTPEGGRIVIRATPEGSTDFRLAVEDDGVGIALADQTRLFRHFQQVHEDVSREHEGTGLGLALVKQIVEAQGGRVGVESTPGEGSTFFVVLPVDPRIARANRQARAAEAEQTALAASS